jgi:ABC-type oligopeptide transport system substrate-binding subunit
VVVGEIGRDQKIEYKAVGDAVNLAARMESNAPVGGVLISDRTHRLVPRIFEFESQGKIQVQGRDDPVEAFLVTGTLIEAGTTRGVEGLYSPMIGRDTERSQLLEIIEHLKDGTGHIVSVVGDAGIGKSRLIKEIKERFAEEDHLWLEGKSRSYGTNLSLGVFQDLVRNYLDVSDGDRPSIVEIKLKSKVRRVFGDHEAEFYPYLANLLNLKLEGVMGDRITDLHLESLKRRIFVVMGKLLEKLALDQPLVIVLEDLHWADPSSIELVKSLLPTVVRNPILLWFSARPYKDQPWWLAKVEAQTEYSQSYTELQLTPLDELQSSQLVESLLDVEDFPKEIKESLLDKTQGNPFFLEEALRGLIDEGAIVQENGSWKATDKTLSIEIPETVQGVLRARIDMLDDGPKHLLQIGAVIGKSFLHSLVEDISGDQWELSAHLQTLQRAELIIETQRLPESEFTFKHALTQEVAYGGLLEEQRKSLHYQVGESIETLFPQKLEEFYTLLGHHWCEAGIGSKAKDYFLKAGDRARLAYAIEEARVHYNRALEILKWDGNEEELSRTLMKLGYVHHLAGDYESMNHTYQEAFEAWDRRSNTVIREDGQTLKYGVSLSMNTIPIDPTLAIDPVSAIISGLIFEKLVTLDYDGSIVPAVAKSWEIFDEGTRYIFHLQHGLQWSDGSEVTAFDFEYAWKRNLDPKTESRLAYMLHIVEGAKDFNSGLEESSDNVGVRALDKRTLEVRLVSPAPYFLYILDLEITASLPRWIIEAHTEDWTKPNKIISNGPFTLLEYNREVSVLMSRNSKYGGAFPGNLSKIEFVETRSGEEFIPFGKSGDLDLVWTPENVSFDEDTFGEYLQVFPGFGTMYFAFNLNVHPFDDRKVRQALAHVVNRDEFKHLRFSRLARGGIIPPSMAGHSPDIVFSYDPEYARALLSETGFPDGKGFPPFEIVVVSELKPAAEMIASNWKKDLGLNVTIQTLSDPNRYLDILKHESFSIMGNGWIADYPDPDSFMRGVFHSTSPFNLFGWKSDEYDSLVEEAVLLRNQSERMRLYQKADEILVREQTLIIPISYINWAFLVKPWVKNLKFNPLMRANMRDVIIDRD